MARAYSGMLGIFAWSLVVLRGLLLDLQTIHILTTGLVVFLVFALIGFCIGLIADHSQSEIREDQFPQGKTLANTAVASKGQWASAKRV